MITFHVQPSLFDNMATIECHMFEYKIEGQVKATDIESEKLSIFKKAITDMIKGMVSQREYAHGANPALLSEEKLLSMQAIRESLKQVKAKKTLGDFTLFIKSSILVHLKKIAPSTFSKQRKSWDTRVNTISYACNLEKL